MDTPDETGSLLRFAANELREIKNEMLRDFAGIGQNEWVADCMENIADSLAPNRVHGGSSGTF